jgi:hypothetical protein
MLLKMFTKRKKFSILLFYCFISCYESNAQAVVSNIDQSKIPAYTSHDVLKMQNGGEVKNAAECNVVLVKLKQVVSSCFKKTGNDKNEETPKK